MNDQEDLLKPIRIRVDSVMMITVAVLFLATVTAGVIYDGIILSLAVGIPAIVIPFFIWRSMPGMLISRLAMASAFVILIAIQIQVSHGLIEMHFGLFVVLAFLLAYRDWRPIIFAAGLIAVHHLAFNFLQAADMDVWVFRNGANLGVVMLHAAYVVFESVILVLLAVQLRIEGIESATVAFLAERITNGDLSSRIELHQRSKNEGMLRSMKIMQDSLSGLVKEIENMVDTAVQGDFSIKIDLSDKQGFGKTICTLLNQFSETTEVGLNDVMRVTSALSAGDLSQKMTKDYPGIFGLTKNGVNHTVDSLTKIISEIHDIVDSASANRSDFSLKMDMLDKQGYTKNLAESFNQLSIVIETSLNDVLRVSNALSEGDLTQTIDKDYPGTLGKVKVAMNCTVDSLKNMIGEIQETTDTISAATKEIAAGNHDLSQRTEEQAASLEQTAASMEELTSTVQANTQGAEHANQLAVDASDIATQGVSVVRQVNLTMNDINQSSRKIGDIISVIDDIAFQTNILALNAAVEAARAGEQGRGFAVVAVEVRNLAQRAAKAAGEIKELIHDSVDKVQDGTKLVAQAGQTMEEIVKSICSVTAIMSEIRAASVEQTSGIGQVNQAIGQMDDVTQQNAALVEQAAAAAESLEEKTQYLSLIVGNFKLHGNSKGSFDAATIQKETTVTQPSISKNPPVAVAKSKLRSLPVTSSTDEWEEF
ncbi:MAG: methyl-accepting chemotaxis protein [Methylobacter sp.]|uniref:methyl-accepting chemotaxis protein n=1 Tax=Methylobacter sp. TaxID=2051955 RepID=UPI00272F3D0F|nr:methyl-accepting chemotaxis protein [Methylobacter sp.]MDP1664786.1 methyl-accepting chemotaxis protein [Methylobacter sp.]